MDNFFYIKDFNNVIFISDTILPDCCSAVFSNKTEQKEKKKGEDE